MPVLLLWCWLFVWTPITWHGLVKYDWTLHYAPHDFNVNQKDITHSQGISDWGDSFIKEGKEIPQWFDVEMGGMPRVGSLTDAREYGMGTYGYTLVRNYKLRNDLMGMPAPSRQIDKAFMNVVKLSGVTFLQICIGMPVTFIVGMVGYGISGFL